MSRPFQIKILIPLLILLILPACERAPKVRIGYFHGGRTMIMYRAKLEDYFANEKVDVDLITKNLHETEWAVLPKNAGRNFFKEKDDFGKATGSELVRLILDGKVEGATIGETAFLLAVDQGHPIVAVAELGFDLTDRPGHAIFIGKGHKVKNARDLQSLTWGARRSAGGDEMYLREFLANEKVSLDKTKIISNIPDDRIVEDLQSGRIQAGYFHLTTIRRMLKMKLGYVYRKMDWINAETSQAVLVFSKKFAKDNPDHVKRIVRALMKKAAQENALPLDIRRRPNVDRALALSTDIQGMDFPQFRDVPTLRSPLLLEMQRLLHRHRFLPALKDISPYIDNSFVEAIAREGK